MRLPNRFLALFAAFNPLYWRSIVHSLRTSEGWWPPMFLIALLGAAGFGGGLVDGIAGARWLLYAWTAPWLIVAMLAAVAALLDSLHNIGRVGLGGLRRSRFWFEIGRTSWIGVVGTAICGLFLGGIEWPLLGTAGEMAFLLVGPLFSVFLISSTVAHLLAFARKHRSGGKARECVDFFYLQCVAGLVVFGALAVIPDGFEQPGVYVPVLVVLVVAAMSSAVVVTLAQRRLRRSDRARDIS